MSYTIDAIEDAIKSTIETALTDGGGVRTDISTPENYLTEGGGNFPLILVRYQGSEPFEGMYPGILNFSIYYLHNSGDSDTTRKTNRIKIYAYMKSVFNALQDKSAGLNLNGSFKLQSDKLYNEDGIMVFEQSWVCVET